MNYTAMEYVGFSEAFEFFNKELFSNSLPDLLVTLRGGQFRGCYVSNKFASRNGDGHTSELTLNPDTFNGRSDIEILSTFVHELVHHQQYHHGSPSRGNYHNKEFARLMEAIGLMTTNDGTPAGKRTGSKMTHLIIPGGRFETAASRFVSENNFKINWQSPEKRIKDRSLDPSKVKFVCRCKPVNAIWGKVFSVPVCPFCLTKYIWSEPSRVQAWIAQQLTKYPAFTAELDRFQKDSDLADSMLDIVIDSYETEEEE